MPPCFQTPRMNRSLCGLIIVLVLITAFSGRVLAGEVRVFAAASMAEAMKELAADFSPKGSGVAFVHNFAASGTLARQIAAGAPADLFISANPRWTDYLLEQKRLAQGTVRPLAENALVFIGERRPAVKAMEDLGRLERIAIGSPNSVPAGRYAQEALSAKGLYQPMLSSGRLIFAKDVRQALMYADRGEVDGAFVYRTDALLARRTVILFEVPRELYSPVVYPAGLTTEGAANPDALAFMNYLQSPEALEVLEKHGFSPAVAVH